MRLYSIKGVRNLSYLFIPVPLSMDKRKVEEILESINSVLGVMDLAPTKPDQRVEELIKKREEARKDKDWATADRIRGELKAMGIEVIDTRDGTIWRRERDSNPR